MQQAPKRLKKDIAEDGKALLIQVKAKSGAVYAKKAKLEERRRELNKKVAADYVAFQDSFIEADKETRFTGYNDFNLTYGAKKTFEKGTLDQMNDTINRLKSAAARLEEDDVVLDEHIKKAEAHAYSLPPLT